MGNLRKQCPRQFSNTGQQKLSKCSHSNEQVAQDSFQLVPKIFWWAYITVLLKFECPQKFHLPIQFRTEFTCLTAKMYKCRQVKNNKFPWQKNNKTFKLSNHPKWILIFLENPESWAICNRNKKNPNLTYIWYLQITLMILTCIQEHLTEYT